MNDMYSYCIVVRDEDGKYYRFTEIDLPSEEVLKYYENHHKTYYGRDAVVVNVFKISD